MRTLKAQVRNGRLVLDERTDLPEGAELDVAVFDDVDRRLDAADRDGGEGADWATVSERLRRSMPRK